MIHPELKDKYQRRFKVFQRDRFTCQLCGRRAPEVIISAVSIIPGYNSGTDGDINLVTLCDACRLGRGIATDLRPFIRRDMLAAVTEFIVEYGPASATQIANELGFNRANISNLLSKRTDKFCKSHKEKTSQFYALVA